MHYLIPGFNTYHNWSFYFANFWLVYFTKFWRCKVTYYIEKEKQRFPFEDYDPERGTRYVGNRLIPWDAPPRPDNRTVWDEDDNKWVDPEVLDARRAAGFARLEAMMAEMPLMTSSRLRFP